MYSHNGTNVIVLEIFERGIYQAALMETLGGFQSLTISPSSLTKTNRMGLNSV